MKDFECHSFVIIIFIHNLSYHYGLQRGTITRTKTKRKNSNKHGKNHAPTELLIITGVTLRRFLFFLFFFLLVLLKFILLFA